jgi:hypothetical protein
MTDHSSLLTLERYLVAPLRVEAPDVVGGLTVFPVFGAEPRLRYRAFAEALSEGLRIGELPQGASVTDLIVENPTDAPVLLYDGQEVLGAQQNRAFDGSILVAAQSKLQVPVNCVERGRWDGTRHDQELAAAPQASPPALRASRLESIGAHVRAGRPARSEQGAVWAHVSAYAERMDVASPTAAMADVYDAHRARLTGMTESVVLRDGQLGALVAIGGEFVALDLVSRPDVFAALHGPLCQGYSLDALDDPRDPGVPGVDDAQAFVDRATTRRILERDAIGLGRDVRFDESNVTGAGVVHEDELIALSAFPGRSDGPPPSPSATRTTIRRPSLRRRAA